MPFPLASRVVSYTDDRPARMTSLYVNIGPFRIISFTEPTTYGMSICFVGCRVSRNFAFQSVSAHLIRHRSSVRFISARTCDCPPLMDPLVGREIWYEAPPLPNNTADVEELMTCLLNAPGTAYRKAEQIFWVRQGPGRHRRACYRK